VKTEKHGEMQILFGNRPAEAGGWKFESSHFDILFRNPYLSLRIIKAVDCTLNGFASYQMRHANTAIK